MGGFYSSRCELSIWKRLGGRNGQVYRRREKDERFTCSACRNVEYNSEISEKSGLSAPSILESSDEMVKLAKFN